MGQLLKSVNSTKTKKKIKKCEIGEMLSNQDMFGFNVQLNFDRNSESYKTSAGGIISILITSFILIFTTQKLIKMFAREDAYKNYTEEIREDEAGKLWNIRENNF